MPMNFNRLGLVLVEPIFVLAAVIVSIPVLLVECIAALLPHQPKRNQATSLTSRPTVTVLIPAHNEEMVIGTTLTSILPQLTNRDQLLIIADNCRDRTAQIARNFGATVIERNDQQNQGKGFALDCGLRQIENAPPEVVIFLDADCHIESNYIESVARLAKTSQRPVQPINLLRTTDKSNFKSTISEFAFMVKNLVRPIGLAQLGLPCMVTMGTAFPWSVIKQISLANDNLVEDMQLGIDLAIAGNPPLFCPDAKVTGVFPRQDRAASIQRTRWEQGHIKTLRTQVPRLIEEAWKQKRFNLFLVGLDLSIPPLSFLVIIWFAVTVIGILLCFFGSWYMAIYSIIEGILLIVAILLAWAKFGSQVISLKSLLSIPKYILWKLPIYLKLFRQPEQKWIRTERDSINVSISVLKPEFANMARSIYKK